MKLLKGDIRFVLGRLKMKMLMKMKKIILKKKDINREILKILKLKMLLIFLII